MTTTYQPGQILYGYYGYVLPQLPKGRALPIIPAPVRKLRVLRPLDPDQAQQEFVAVTLMKDRLAGKRPQILGDVIQRTLIPPHFFHAGRYGEDFNPADPPPPLPVEWQIVDANAFVDFLISNNYVQDSGQSICPRTGSARYATDPCGSRIQCAECAGQAGHITTGGGGGQTSPDACNICPPARGVYQPQPLKCKEIG